MPQSWNRFRAIALACLAGSALLRGQPLSAPWSTYGHDSQHSGQSSVRGQNFGRIKWSTPVDHVLANTPGTLFIHYGSPVITAANSVVVPVRTTDAVFQLDVRNGDDGSLKYSLTTDYQLPPHDWVPGYGPVISARGRLYYAGAGGTILYRDRPDAATGASGRLAFYGIRRYNANKASLDNSVYISTPLISDRNGDIYFGYLVTGPNPLDLKSGVARISAAGAGSSISATEAAGGDDSITQVQMNSAPALSKDESTLYFAVNSGNWTAGYLTSVDSHTLSPLNRVRLRDPMTNNNAIVMDDSSASPTVGPDGDVYFGVLENPFPANDGRGWLLHFNWLLSETKIPGAFGWDTTPTIVPSAIVASYDGPSSYLIFTKYNNYLGAGAHGDGQNRIAILDPNTAAAEQFSGVPAMREVMTVLGPTESAEGRKEWCINSGAVDLVRKSIIANNEDGVLYRWDLTTGELSQQIRLTSGVGEAYTPTIIGAHGIIYAINDAVLFAVGQ